MKAQTLYRCAALSVVAACIPLAVAVSQSAAEKARFETLVARFEPATVIGTPSIEPCTLSKGTETFCLKITTLAAPPDHPTGPYCPQTITDTAEQGGTWVKDGEVYDVDGPFIANLATFYNDDAWQMFDPDTGEIYRRAGELGCLVAGDPRNTTNQPDNICVQCEIENMGKDVTTTYFIPLSPTEVGGWRTWFGLQDQSGPRGGAGLALNGVRLDGPAPLDLILGGHTLGPFDDCGAHVNPHEGYHYHGVTDCGTRLPAEEEGHATLVGIALDGYDMYDQRNAAGDEPGDLDTCRGHDDDALGYHYHVGAPGENRILPCHTGETGCLLDNPDAVCDSAAHRRRGPPGGPPPAD